jgi:hypothetical protein
MIKERKPFNEDIMGTYKGLLEKITEDPGSKSVLSPFMFKKVEAFLSSNIEKTPLSVWNFYKEMLDYAVHGGGAGFVVKLFDLEPFYAAPLGAFSHEAGNMGQAPWREI